MSSFSWFSELVDMSMTSKTNYSWLWTHPIIQNNPRKIITILGNSIVRKVLEIRLINSWKSWVWDQDQYLPRTMKWKSWIFDLNWRIPSHPSEHPTTLPSTLHFSATLQPFLPNKCETIWNIHSPLMLQSRFRVRLFILADVSIVPLPNMRMPIHCQA